MLVATGAGILPLVINRLTGDRCAKGTGNRAGEFADELLEGGDGGGGEIRAGDAYVHVEVGDGAFECLGVLLHPLS